MEAAAAQSVSLGIKLSAKSTMSAPPNVLHSALDRPARP